MFHRVLVVVMVSSCSQPVCPVVTPAPHVTAQPYGGPCEQTSDCVQGFECLPSGSQGLLTCSRQCTSDRRLSCPAPADDCLYLRDDAGSGVCQRSCEPDGGCPTGALLTRCSVGTCRPMGCRTPRGPETEGCPEGAFCAGDVCNQHLDAFGNPGGWELKGGWCRVAQ